MTATEPPLNFNRRRDIPLFGDRAFTLVVYVTSMVRGRRLSIH
jgi:hypothetical protein